MRKNNNSYSIISRTLSIYYAESYSMITAKTIDVMGENWDYLIILDACRYDYFSNIYEKYFFGELEKKISLGSTTPEWCLNSFPSYYSDVIYVSGNPYINSKVAVAGFDARRHFYKIIDVWEFGWSEELGTVPPVNINKEMFDLVQKFPDKRFIIHYLQPHSPYISSKFQSRGFPNPHPHPKYNNVLFGIQGHSVNRILEILFSLLGTFMRTKLMKKLWFIKTIWKLREIMRLPPASPIDAVRRKYGVDGLREAYKKNLRIVLGHVAELCNEILYNEPSKSLVITSDHGEFLGENGTYGHGYGSRDPILLEVPFFRITHVRKNHSKKLSSWSEKTKLKKRIERLKRTGSV